MSRKGYGYYQSLREGCTQAQADQANQYHDTAFYNLPDELQQRLLVARNEITWRPSISVIIEYVKENFSE